MKTAFIVFVVALLFPSISSAASYIELMTNPAKSEQSNIAKPGKLPRGAILLKDGIFINEDKINKIYSDFENNIVEIHLDNSYFIVKFANNKASAHFRSIICGRKAPPSDMQTTDFKKQFDDAIIKVAIQGGMIPAAYVYEVRIIK